MTNNRPGTGGRNAPPTLRQRAEQMLRTSRTDISKMSDEDVQKLIHELQVHQMELKLQNEELLDSQLELANSRDQYSDLYDFAPVAYMTIDSKGAILQANLTAARMLGVERRQLITHKLTDFVKPESQDDCFRHLQAVFSDARKITGELTMDAAGHATRVMQLESLAVDDTELHPPRCRTALIDVTEQREATEWMVQAKRLRSMVENLPAGAVFVENDQIEINRAAEEITGYFRSELKSVDDWFGKLFGSRDMEIRQLYAVARTGGFRHPVSVTITRKDGEQRIVDFVAHGFDDHEVWILHDMTVQKSAERRMRLFQRALQSATNGILISDARQPDNPVIYANQAVETITGYPAKEIIGRNCRFLQGEYRQQEAVNKMRQAINENRECHVVFKNYRKDGTLFWNRLTLSPIKDESGNVTHYVGIQDDITESHQAQKELEREKALLEGIVNGVSDALLLTDMDRNITYCNPAVPRIFGYRPEELLGQSTMMLYVNPEDFHVVSRERFRPDANVTVDSYEADWRRKDGTTFHGECNGTIILDAEDRPLGFLILIRDVTERNLNMEALRRQQELSEGLINTAQSIVLLLDMQGNIVRFNPYFESLTGWTLDELKGHNWIETCIPENERMGMQRVFAIAVSGERTVGKVNGVLCRDGRIRTIEWYDAVLCDDEGEQIGLLGTGQDITERRALERHLLQIADLEKRRMGHDLHDGLGQELTGLAMMADSLMMDLKNKELPESEIAEKIAVQVDMSLQHVRALARGMNPLDIDPQGLGPELTELASHASSLYGIDCLFVGKDRVRVIDSETATNMYRIAQEAITNAVKHGNASKVEISITRNAGQLALHVSDNGVGISDYAEKRSGVGMRSMRYRADIIGGTLRIERGEPCGTVVSCLLPDEQLYQKNN